GCGDDVALAQVGAVGRGVGIDGLDAHHERAQEVEVAQRAPGQACGADRYAELNSTHAPVLQEFAHDPGDGLAGDGPADAGLSGDGSGVDADDVAAGVGEGAAEVVGGECEGVLDDVFDRFGGSRDNAPEGSNDAGRNSGLQAQGVGDGDGDLPGAQ